MTRKEARIAAKAMWEKYFHSSFEWSIKTDTRGGISFIPTKNPYLAVHVKNSYLETGKEEFHCCIASYSIEAEWSDYYPTPKEAINACVAAVSKDVEHRAKVADLCIHSLDSIPSDPNMILPKLLEGWTVKWDKYNWFLTRYRVPVQLSLRKDDEGSQRYVLSDGLREIKRIKDRAGLTTELKRLNTTPIHLW